MSHTPILIHLFGPPEIRVNGEPLPRLKTRKGLYILVLLTLRQGREVERNWLAGTLWPENEETTALTYLRQALTDLRHALGDAAGRLLSPSPRTLRLDLDGPAADVDFIRFEQCRKRGDTASLEQAIALYRGPLLEGWAEEWLLGEREACEQSYLGALESLARQATEARDSVRYLRLIVAAEPLRESACRALMEALAATRDYGAVTEAYRCLRTALRREINAEPSAETRALFARLRAEARRGATGISASGRENVPIQTGTSPVAGRAANRAVSLPRPLSEFIGRVREVDALKRALMVSRLVTLTGIGGVGKTRLSLRTAEEVADDFPNGVRFVDLSPLTDPALVAKTVAVTLGFSEQANRSLTETICEHLRERHLLLVLDNCEHLIDECARFAAALLQECPGVHILATSRQRLGITGETVRRVPPLTLPDLNRLPEDEVKAAAVLLETEAVRLFADRAQRVQPNLCLNPQTLRAIAATCSRLDGIPLALELAAARMSALGPEQIAARLKEHFCLLSGNGGDRAAPARQRTLRAALDWSYDLLLPEERVLLCRLTVFAGGWTLEAAEAVCAGNGLEEGEVLDCLTGLADHSLVVVETENGQARYGLLEIVREYGRERLREGGREETAVLRARHRDYFLRLAQDAVPHLSGLKQAEALDRLEREHDNLRATLDACLEEGTIEAVHAGLLLAGYLQRFWMQRGYAGEGRARYAALLSRDCAEPELTPARARALEGAGTLAYRQGDYAAAREMLEESLTIHRYHGDRLAEATPLGLLASIAFVQGNYWGARTLFEQALALRREAGHRPGEATVLNGMGNIAVKQGDHGAARAFYEQALAISQEVGDRALEASILNGLGLLAEHQKDYAAALSWFEQALARNREIGDSSQTVVNTYNLANIAYTLGDVVAAQEYFRQALLLTRALGESRSRRLIGFLLEGMAMTALEHAQPKRAARLLGASDAQLEAIGVMRTASADREEYDGLVADLQAALGEEPFAALREEGRALRMDQAVTLALEQ